MVAKRMMEIGLLLPGAPKALASLSVSGIVSDSRKASEDDLFFGLAGEEHVTQAFSHGARVAIVQHPEEGLSETDGHPVWRTPAAQALLGQALATFHRTNEGLLVAGVTGTNGKSSVTHLLAQVLPQPGYVIGTLGWGRSDALRPQDRTTPAAVELHQRIAACRNDGAKSIALEVSSHGLAQERITGLTIDLAVFTNLSRDHLDYHGDMASYLAAKAKLFQHPGLRWTAINGDDPAAPHLSTHIPAQVETVTYGQNGGDFRLLQQEETRHGLSMRIATPAGEVALRTSWLGGFQSYNFLAALAGAWVATKDEPQQLADALAKAPCVSGRMETIFSGADMEKSKPLTVVDFAHTPDALDHALRSLRPLCPHITVVFGCGGERDMGKRPLMGKIAEDLADRIIVTDDNPRHEDPERIIDAIIQGMAHPRDCQPIGDRETAITQAIAQAPAEGCVLIAGKGHENYQERAGQRLPFSDQQVARLALERYPC